MLKINLPQVEKKMFFLLGLFTSMAVLQVPLGVTTITPFNLMMYVLFAFEIVYRKIKISGIDSYIYLFYSLCAILSSIYNYFFLPSNWGKANFISLFNILTLGYFLVFLEKDAARSLREDFLTGLKANAWIQMFWGILQYIVYRANGASLNQIIFGNLFHIKEDYIQSNVYRGVNRLTGLNWEPAYFGLTLVIGYALSKKMWQKGLFALVIIISGSRTSLITLLAVVLSECLYSFFSKNKFSKKQINKEGLVAVAFLAIFIVALVYNWSSLVTGFNSTLSRFKNLNTDPSSKVHMMYYQKLGDLLFNKYNWVRCMLGIGPASSGHAYTLYYGLYEYFVDPWNIENGIAYLFVSYGIVGACLALAWFFNNLFKTRTQKSSFALIIGVLVGGITYSYFVNWIWVIVFFLSLPKKDLERKKI